MSVEGTLDALADDARPAPVGEVLHLTIYRLNPALADLQASLQRASRWYHSMQVLQLLWTCIVHDMFTPSYDLSPSPLARHDRAQTPAVMYATIVQVTQSGAPAHSQGL